MFINAFQNIIVEFKPCGFSFAQEGKKEMCFYYSRDGKLPSKKALKGRQETDTIIVVGILDYSEKKPIFTLRGISKRGYREGFDYWYASGKYWFSDNEMQKRALCRHQIAKKRFKDIALRAIADKFIKRFYWNEITKSIE